MRAGSNMGDRAITEKHEPEQRDGDRREKKSRRRNLLRWGFEEQRSISRRKGHRRDDDQIDKAIEEATED
jgi:hypothetical protein